uniref:Uncharacterized protein n=1 Tax=Pristionchus pacificus TaxID=54126 RepID=A0A2A6CX67_PRIPA|eukprot:PDM82676.1 hypothetical protein PRIPAC_37069 [Pristionchus pacificus]
MKKGVCYVVAGKAHRNPTLIRPRAAEKPLCCRSKFQPNDQQTETYHSTVNLTAKNRRTADVADILLLKLGLNVECGCRNNIENLKPSLILFIVNGMEHMQAGKERGSIDWQAPKRVLPGKRYDADSSVGPTICHCLDALSQVIMDPRNF